MMQQLILRWVKDPSGVFGDEAVFLGKWKIARHYRQTGGFTSRSESSRIVVCRLPGMKTSTGASGKEKARSFLEEKILKWFSASGLNVQVSFERAP